MDGRRRNGPARLVSHCLLIEADQYGLVLVDTGLGLRDVRTPRPRLSGFFLRLNRPPLREEEMALRQIERLGFCAADVRHIVLTHLDFDHAGGIEDFPGAEVHVFRPELAAATEGRRGFVARRRYRPMQWDENVRWQPYDVGGEHWLGFTSVRNMRGLPPEILLIPLIGHTWGHCGVAIQRDSGWLRHAGDAYFHFGEMDLARPHCPPGLRAYQWMMEVDRRARLGNQERLRALARAGDGAVQIFCAHDEDEFERLRARSDAEIPASERDRIVPHAPVEPMDERPPSPLRS